jgi:hypothetical protein
MSGLAAGTLSALAAIALVGLSAAQANAAVGNQAGALTISPGSGPVTATGLRYASTTACPTGFQGSGLLQVVDPGGGGFNNIAAVNDSVAAPFSGSLNATFALAIQVFPDLPGKTAELVIQCSSGPSATGSHMYAQDTFVTIDAAGGHYTISGSGGTTANPTATPTSTEGAASTGGDTIPLGVTVASGASPTPTAAPATGGGTGPVSNLALAATGAAVVLAGGGLILLAWQRRRQGAG